MKRGDKVQFILAGGKERVDDLHGNLDFDFGLLGILFVEDVDDQVVTLFGHAHVAIVTLHGDEFAVLGGADGVDECAQVDIVDVGVVDLDLAVMNTVLVDGRERMS